MLENASKKPPRSATLDRESQIIPDPWESETSTAQSPTDTQPNSSQFSTQFQALISAATPLDVLKLPTTKFNQIRILLEDWLKLRAEDAEQLTVQLNNALALLCWLETKTQLEG